jgi:hypothetical protein
MPQNLGCVVLIVVISEIDVTVPSIGMAVEDSSGVKADSPTGEAVDIAVEIVRRIQILSMMK